jgi:8-oxo-dGTP pyrophosphatase MutT (NUDIX family)
MKLANYRDRATLILHDGKGNVFAAPNVDGPEYEPFFVPGGGIYEEEGTHPEPDEDTIRAGLEREAMEEVGVRLKDIQDFGFKPTIINKDKSWQEKQQARRGIPYKGIREYLRAAVSAGEDKSIHGSAGDDFLQYSPRYMNAVELANALEEHNLANRNKLDPDEYAVRDARIKFIRELSKQKTAEEKRYRPKVQGLLYTPDLRVLAAKSQGAGSGLREFPNYKFPGGGIEQGESLIDAAKKELLEETGYTTAGDPFEFGMPSATVDWDEAFRQQALKKGRDFHGEISHFLAAPVGARDMSLHGKEGDQLLDADFVPIDSLIADLEHTSSLPDNEYAVFDKTKLEAARKFKEYMRTKKAYYIGKRLAILSHS